MSRTNELSNKSDKEYLGTHGTFIKTGECSLIICLFSSDHLKLIFVLWRTSSMIIKVTFRYSVPLENFV